jgi:hypothetical protein
MFRQSPSPRVFLGLVGIAALAAIVAFGAVNQPSTSQAGGGLVISDVDDGLDPEDLAQSLVGPGVVIDNVEYTGDDRALGQFSGGLGIIGFELGLIMSTGQVKDAVGPNESDSTSTNLNEDGDPDLTDLVGAETFDAAVLEFDFVPDTNFITFRYVFASEEYNEFVGSQYNDVFAFFVNGENCALVPDPANPGQFLPVSINTVNNGQPGVSPVNSHLYINNDPFDPDSTGETVPTEDLLDTEFDGLTRVLSCSAEVNPGEPNSMKLAIADTADEIYDSAVFIQAGSLVAAEGQIWGDADCDGSVAIGDALKIARFLLGLSVSQTLPCPFIGQDVAVTEPGEETPTPTPEPKPEE